MSSEPRERWGSRAGFLLAAVGSAVGLGNMWRFSYLTAENGGAAFVVLYLAMTALVGLPVMLAEFTIGRGAGRSPVAALVHFGGGVWRPLGILFVASGALILSYYSVIAGWTLRYGLDALVSGFGSDAAGRFDAIAFGPGAAAWHLGFMALTIFVVGSGVRTGIERTSIVLMPALFLILVGLAIYAWTRPGSAAGYAYYLQTDFREILSFDVLKDAASQAFFSLSLGMGAMLTYASYLGREDNLPSESVVVAGSDFLVAFVAGLVVFPLIFALGLQQEVKDSTTGALFITLPHGFAEMGGVGRVVGFFFFAALVVGALTSAISLLEVVVATAIDELGWTRHKAVLVAGVAIALLGLPSSLDGNVLGAVDKLSGNVFLIFGALALAVFTGWFMPDPEGEASVGTHGVRWFFLWRSLLRFVVPAVLAVVLFYAVPDTWTALAALFR